MIVEFPFYEYSDRASIGRASSIATESLRRNGIHDRIFNTHPFHTRYISMRLLCFCATDIFSFVRCVGMWPEEG